jgi:ribosome recycling factor
MIDNVKKKLDAECQNAIKHFKNETAKIRSGRANSVMLEGIMVEYYGTMSPLNQVGMINAPEARMLTVQVFDFNAVDNVEKAIKNAGLGLNPSKDGNLLRIPIPSLTDERRKEFVKTLGKMAEDSRVGIRNHRRDANDALKKLKDDKKVTEDDFRKAQEEVQKHTDKFIKEVDVLAQAKEKEIMAV